jgi:peptide/nickel transport system ATP-binding protein
MTAVLEVEDLNVTYRTGVGAAVPVPAVNGVSFHVAAGETLGLVGESGCGKTTIALTIARSLPPSAITTGRITFDGTDLLALSGTRLREWWRNDFAMVYQEPQAALNPTMRVGAQIAEVLRVKGASRDDARAGALDLLRAVAMNDPAAISRRYPHQLSGGQQQRVVISMALAIRPRLLVLDEPTTGLDATVEREILQLISELRGELAAAVLYITHDLGLVERMCDRVAVLQAGRIEEHGDVSSVLVTPTNAYTKDLLASAMVPGRTKDNDPRSSLAEVVPERPTRTAPPVPAPAVGEAGAMDATPLVRVRGVVKRYGSVLANDGVTLDIGAGEIVGLVGESGSGKTTLGRIITGLTAQDAGDVELRGAPLANDLRRRRPEDRRAIQMVFQSPDNTLNPRHRVRHVLGRAIKKLGGRRSVDELAAACRLNPGQLDRLTSTLSGGQKQRVAIARAIAGDPALVVCDEPVSALDVSVQATILRLLVDLQRDRDVSLLFVSHDLGVVRYLSDRIAVMYGGRIVEHGPASSVLAPPYHPYTAELLAASEHRPIQATEQGARPLAAPVAAAASRGCPFAARCPQRIDGLCDTVDPPVQTLECGLQIECHVPFGALDDSEAPIAIQR